MCSVHAFYTPTAPQASGSTITGVRCSSPTRLGVCTSRSSRTVPPGRRRAGRRRTECASCTRATPSRAHSASTGSTTNSTSQKTIRWVVGSFVPQMNSSYSIWFDEKIKAEDLEDSSHRFSSVTSTILTYVNVTP